MKKIKNFNEITYQNINENINNSLNNNFNHNDTQRQIKKILKKININIYHVENFTIGLSSFVKLINYLIKNNNYIKKYDNISAIIITLCIVGVLTLENKEKVKKLFDFAVKNDILQDDIDIILKQIKTILNIYYSISFKLNRKYNSLDLILRDTNLSILLNDAVSTLIDNEYINTDLLLQGINDFKLVLGEQKYELLEYRILKIINNKSNNTTKFQNKENIKPLLVNDELKSPSINKGKASL